MNQHSISTYERLDWWLPDPVGVSTGVYAMYGHHVQSDIPLPVPRTAVTEGTHVDWVIRRATSDLPTPVPACPLIDDHRADDGSVIDRFYRGDQVAYLWDSLAGTFRLEPTERRVTVYPLPTADEDDVGLVVLGPVSSFMLHQTGYPNLHASAVVTPHGVCAFVGPSTLGKSTLAAGLLRSGGRLLTDDILPLEFRRDGVYGIPSAPMMKVWSNTAEQTFGITADLPRLSSLTEKRLLDLGRHQYAFAAEASRLSAIYVPRRYDPVIEGQTDVRVEPLTARDAALALLSQTYRGHYLNPPELATLLGKYTQLVKQARVARIHVPHGLQYQEAVTERILMDLAGR